ncbi:hypothetical protein E2N92_02570 [Methanofollis formosanus]|uniref:Uncharacterized protein n=1 Tax=Methanofollis formosanus TaxID=299308 RepID=A0A8G0ZZL9_9EURY|nr:hypothetical protein [Methanofollis formosanus]QYZ78395.1 hypothetical protein E2N92_02570 [Methanofollis formosanus]
MSVIHRSLALACLLALCLCTTVGTAHVPVQGGENDHLDHALAVEDPEKSWVVYDTLPPGGGVKYYRFDLEEGDELRLGLFTPGRPASLPTLVVMGPEVAPSGAVPSGVEVPPDTGAVVVESTPPERPEYEPFTPSALYPVAAYTLVATVPGTYYAAVAGDEGNFGLSVGFREEFSPSEWLGVPLSVVGVHLWEGQSPALVFGPLVLTLALGAVFLFRAPRRPDLPGLLALVAGLLYVGGGAMVLLQMGITLAQTGWAASALFTLLFALGPMLLGVVALRAGMESERKGFFLKMAGVGLLGLLLWAGLVLGPLLALAAALAGAFWRGR